MPEVAGNAAHLVDPFDIEDMKNGILKVIAEDTYREQLIENGYENAKKFAVEKIVKDYCEVYEEISNRSN
jgi:glycosyltransferase involved in cell wall biosynthesis